MKKYSIVLIAIVAAGCAGGGNPAPGSGAQMVSNDEGPADQGTVVAREDGDAALGREVFRFETFGNEGFWTDALRLPAGVSQAKVTPLQLLDLGVQIDIDALDDRVRRMLRSQLESDPSGRSSALLNDPATTNALINANAVIGMPVKDSNRDGRMDVGAGDKVGTSCALCHTITDASMLRVANGGSIGKRIDGPALHVINLGKIFATALNTRALYPIAQLSLKANGGKTLGRAPTGLDENSSEAQFDAYFSNPSFYPVGMFDDSFDGNGDPMHNSPLFRQDLAAPFGSEGAIARLDNFSNLVYTSLFDLTMLTTPGGRAFLHKLGGAAGDEIADDYVKILKATGVTGYPFAISSPHARAGEEEAPLGMRVDNGKLLGLNAYLAGLPAPRGARNEQKLATRGRAVFMQSGCTGCHNADQSRRVPANIVAMKTIFPADAPVVLAQREPPLSPVLNSPGIFDDKMAVVNASMRGEKRGIALPLLLDLARKPVFLHDNSASSLETLFDGSRGTAAPHPFYVTDRSDRMAVIAYLRSLDTRE